MMKPSLMNRFLWIVSIVSWLFLNSGCASWGTFNPATGQKEFIVIPTKNEVLMGSDLHKDIVKKYPLSKDPVNSERVRSIGRKLAAISDRQDYKYSFYLLESAEINAFTVPGGRIYIFSGLVNKLPSDDAIASVLAHEIGHCAAKHSVKKFQAALAYDFIGTIVLNLLSEKPRMQQIASLSSNAVMQIVFSSYSRQDEYEADRLGLKYMRLAGYNPQGMVDTLELLERESKGSKIPLFLRTHPYVHDRIIAVKKNMAQNKQP